eukprot:TRINITY_DN7559_c0_g1_i2.p2 TRINITY_DN7559_c0_g1~~TRINITY_DN7559_c0_g1_i2.p2  ORF type:complete len:374 (+),score=155.24 TRINITY_DN7559_c0_g1_i2:1402-2523(+)
MTGGWTFHWQGPTSDSEFISGKTIFQGLKEATNNSNVILNFYNPCPIASTSCQDDMSSMASPISSSDVIIACTGENVYAEKPGDIRDLTLQKNQVEMLNFLGSLESSSRTVLILLEGRPRVLPISQVEKFPAVIQGWLPGPHGGRPMADILLGNLNPSGKLPMTYPKFPGDFPNYYYHKCSESISFDPLWEFGKGLSYTNFVYSNLTLSDTVMTPEKPVTLRFKLKNSGNRSGKETVLVYVSDLYRSVAPEVEMLKNFRKVSLDVNQEISLEFQLEAEDVGFYGLDGTFQIEEGDFEITVGDMRIGFRLDVPSNAPSDDDDVGGGSNASKIISSILFVILFGGVLALVVHLIRDDRKRKHSGDVSQLEMRLRS